MARLCALTMIEVSTPSALEVAQREVETCLHSHVGKDESEVEMDKSIYLCTEHHATIHGAHDFIHSALTSSLCFAVGSRLHTALASTIEELANLCRQRRELTIIRQFIAKADVSISAHLHCNNLGIKVDERYLTTLFVVRFTYIYMPLRFWQILLVCPERNPEVERNLRFHSLCCALRLLGASIIHGRFFLAIGLVVRISIKTWQGSLEILLETIKLIVEFLHLLSELVETFSELVELCSACLECHIELEVLVHVITLIDDARLSVNQSASTLKVAIEHKGGEIARLVIYGLLVNHSHIKLTRECFLRDGRDIETCNDTYYAVIRRSGLLSV